MSSLHLDTFEPFVYIIYIGIWKKWQMFGYIVNVILCLCKYSISTYVLKVMYICGKETSIIGYAERIYMAPLNDSCICSYIKNDWAGSL